MVAREAGVSASTVSRIINGTVNVSDPLRLTVEAAIAKFNFQPNAAARGLALGKTFTIGVVAGALDSPSYWEGFCGIEVCLRHHGYVPLFMSGNRHEDDEDGAMRELIARGVDGIIVFAGRVSNAKLQRYARQVPIVVTGRQLRSRGLFSLQIDDNLGVMLAVGHLFELGHRRIAFITGSDNHPVAARRLADYKKALENAGVCFDPQLVKMGDWHEEGGLRATQELLDSNQEFTALLCVNDQTAYGALLGLSRNGLAVPRDVSVVGLDDLQPSAYQVPPLTTVRQSMRTLGEHSARAVFELLAGRRPRRSSIPAELVVRESTCRIGALISAAT